MIKAASALQKSVIIFYQEMQEQLEFYVEDVQIFSGQMMELSSGVSQVGNMLLKTRTFGKEYIRTEEISKVNSVAETMNTKSSQMNKSAGGMSDLSSSLRDMTSVFKVSREDAEAFVDMDMGLKETDIPDLMPWTMLAMQHCPWI